MNTNHSAGTLVLMMLVTVCIALSGCTPPTAGTTPTSPPPNPPIHTATPVATAMPATPTATPVPLPKITWRKGDSYFTFDGKQQLFFSRNVAALYLSDFDSLMKWSREGGTRIVRIQLDNLVAGGNGYTKTGDLDETWAKNWERVFDSAEANGVQVLVVFSSWAPWNDPGLGGWATNPLNKANGGPASNPTELLKKDSATQRIWLEWVKTLVARWQGRQNVFAWEIFSEVNLITGATETTGVEFMERTAAVIRDHDAHHRPITASLADMGDWPSFYNSKAIDFINFHPYPSSGKLDSYVIHEVRRYMATYNKPVLIGESGLNAAVPDSKEGKATVAENAPLGVKHAIWAEVVSGAMNGRALWWEDGYGIYFPALSWSFLQKYSDIELPAARFVQDIDFAGFRPLTVNFPAGTHVWGAAIGNEKMVIGWFRDATCEPPDWKLQPVIAKQTVTITVPGSAARWKVDFYSTRTGTDTIGSATVARKGSGITITLPDFTDDIAFKLVAQPGAAPTPGPSLTTHPIAGQWTGTISGEQFSTSLELSIQPDCRIGSVCGTVSTPQLPCSGELFLKEIIGDTYVFVERNMSGASFCASGGVEYLQLQADGTLSYRYEFTSSVGDKITSSAILKRS